MNTVIVLHQPDDYEQQYDTDKPIFFLIDFLHKWLGLNEPNRNYVLKELTYSILDPTDTGTCSDCICHERINGEIHINLWDKVGKGIDDYIIEPENLVIVMQEWVKCINAQVENIIITQDDDGYTDIGTTTGIEEEEPMTIKGDFQTVYKQLLKLDQVSEKNIALIFEIENNSNISNEFNETLKSIQHNISESTNDKIIKIELANSNLTSIPLEILNFNNLKEIDLANNQITGSISPELEKLKNLQSLNLSMNQLTGSIPPELGKLINLQSLQLYFNELTGPIPPQLGKLISLQNLDLSNNQLTGSIPSELEKLKNLLDLGLNHNQLTGSIPPGLGKLKKLNILYLENNQLTGEIPWQLGKLKQLTFLDLSNNQLSGKVPQEIYHLHNLEEKNLSGNKDLITQK